MSTGLIVVLVILALIVILAVGGAIAQRRRMERNRAAFEAQLAQANRDLVAARAEDRGWDRAALEAAARQAYAERHPGAPEPELTLIRVVDRPGTDDDKAIFQVRAGTAQSELTLGRHEGAWVLETLT